MTGSPPASIRRLILQPCLMLTSVEPSSALTSGERAPQSMHVKRWPVMAPTSHRDSPLSSANPNCLESMNVL
jgi:hypothetical protein